MFPRLLIATLLTVLTAGVASAQYPVTLLLRNGERVGGNMTYQTGSNQVALNGRSYSWDDIAVIAYVPNDPTPREVSQVPSVDNDPNWAERHVFVTRDGRMIRGKLYAFSPDGRSLIYEVAGGARIDIPADQLARAYINPAAARGVYGPILAALPNSDAAAGTNPAVGTSGSTVIVPGNQQWTATGFDVRRFEVIRFNASGEVMWSPEAADRATPGGAVNRRNSGGRAPVRNAPGGALVARIGNGTPFLLGNQGSVRMPAGGELFLGINDEDVSDNTGNFSVTISR